MPADRCRRYVVRVGEREILLTPDVVRVVQEYIHRPMGLEELAERLGLESWEEAYEFIKRVPAWIIWMPITMLESRLREEGCLE